MHEQWLGHKFTTTQIFLGTTLTLCHMHIGIDCALSPGPRPCLITSNSIFSKTVLAACRFIPRYFDWEVQRLCWSKGTSLEYAELIYVKTSDELRCFEEEEEEE